MTCTWRYTEQAGHWHQIFLTVVARNRQNVIIPPRTKKNSSIPIRLKNGRTVILPSSDFKKWEKAATQSMVLCLHEMKRVGLYLIDDYIGVQALIYRQINQGDVNGFTQAIGDWLESSGIIANDRQIDNWDGSQRLKDAVCPRIELCLTYLRPAPQSKSKNRKLTESTKVQEPALLLGLPLWDRGRM